MKVLMLVMVIIAGSTLTRAQGKILVTVKNIANHKGNIRVGLFNNEKDFLKNAVEGKVVKASEDVVTVTFENLTNGEYAISVIHDENENGELDTNMIGIPKEGFAFGNNAMGAFGPPSFEKAKIKVEKDLVQQEITMKYM